MDATACHIGGHHRANVARAEGFQDLQTLHLVHIAREHFAGDTTATQSFADAFRRELAVTEDDRASTRMLGQVVVEQRELLFRTCNVDELTHRVGRQAVRFNLHTHRITHPHRGQVHDRFVERCRIEHRATVVAVRQTVHNRAHIRNEAHVKHAVGFVDDQRVHLAQVHNVIAHKVNQAARRGHEQVHGFVFEFATLTVVVHATIDSERTHIATVATQSFSILTNLNHQFTRRRQDERTRRARLQITLFRRAEVTRQHGNQERCRLARTSLCATCHILTRKRVFQRLSLNRRAVLEFQIRNSMQNFRRQIEVGKTLLALCFRHDIRGWIPCGMSCGIGLQLFFGKRTTRTFHAVRGVFKNARLALRTRLFTLCSTVLMFVVATTTMVVTLALKVLALLISIALTCRIRTRLRRLRPLLLPARLLMTLLLRAGFASSFAITARTGGA